MGGIKSSLVLLACAALISGSACGQDMGLLEAAAKQAVQDGLFAGMVHITRGDTVVFSEGFGDAVPELAVPMRNDHRYPIGSNTKLFTAVAVWQLHKAGKLNVFDPVTRYLNTSELGLSGPWCPKAYNASKDGPCQVPNLQQLLRMSGGVLGFDNCAYPEDAWQQQYCLTGARIGSGMNNFTNIAQGQFGALSIVDYIKASGVLDMPLDFAPGTGYHYSNPGYTLAGYIVEKVSQMPLADYYQSFIFNKANLSSTIYDVSNGAVGLHKDILPYPAYISYLTPAAGQLQAAMGIHSLNDLVGSVGSLKSWQLGDVNNKTLVRSNPDDVLNPTTAQPAGVYAFTAKYPGPSNLDYSLGNAAGAIVSTPQDMAKWFRVFVSQPELLGLDRETLKSMFNLSTVVLGVEVIGNVAWLFVQGVLVVPDPNHPRGLGVSHLYYVGSLGGFRAVLYVELDPTDPAKDLFVNVVASTVLPEVATWPSEIGFSSDNKCVYAASSNNGTSTDGTTVRAVSAATRRGLRDAAAAPVAGDGGTDAAASHSVSRLLCEVKMLEPVAMRALDNLLVTKAVRAMTGKNWFGLA